MRGFRGHEKITNSCLKVRMDSRVQRRHHRSSGCNTGVLWAAAAALTPAAVPLLFKDPIPSSHIPAFHYTARECSCKVGLRSRFRRMTSTKAAACPERKLKEGGQRPTWCWDHWPHWPWPSSGLCQDFWSFLSPQPGFSVAGCPALSRKCVNWLSQGELHPNGEKRNESNILSVVKHCLLPSIAILWFSAIRTCVCRNGGQEGTVRT